MRDSIIINFDDEYVYAECILEEFKGKTFKIPRKNVRPDEWIAIGEGIWCVEHNIWNFNKMFDK